MDQRGRLIVMGSGGLPQVWTLGGQYQSTIGRLGRGPGEFSTEPSFRVGPGDSLWFFHGMQVSVFSPEGRYSRSFRTEMPIGAAVVFGDGRIAFHGASSLRELAGLQLHIVDDSGRHLNSFALVPPGPSTVHTPHLNPLQLAPLRQELWTSDGLAYGLHLWRLDGTLISSFRRDAPWFRTRFDQADPREPISIMTSGRFDALGRLWTLSRDASPNWERFLPPPPQSRGGEMSLAALQQDKLYDSVIEVIDLDNARVLAHARVPGFPLALLGEGYLATYHVDGGDIPYIQIWRIAFPK